MEDLTTTPKLINPRFNEKELVFSQYEQEVETTAGDNVKLRGAIVLAPNQNKQKEAMLANQPLLEIKDGNPIKGIGRFIISRFNPVTHVKSIVSFLKGKKDQIELTTIFPNNVYDAWPAIEKLRFEIAFLEALKGADHEADSDELKMAKMRLDVLRCFVAHDPNSREAILRGVETWRDAALYALNNVWNGLSADTLNNAKFQVNAIYSLVAYGNGVLNIKEIRGRMQDKLQELLGLSEDEVEKVISKAHAETLNRREWPIIFNEFPVVVKLPFHNDGEFEVLQVRDIITPVKHYGMQYPEGVNGYSAHSYDTDRAVNLNNSEFHVYDPEKDAWINLFQGMRHGAHFTAALQGKDRKVANESRAKDSVLGTILANPIYLQQAREQRDSDEPIHITGLSINLQTPDIWRDTLENIGVLSSEKSERDQVDEQFAAWRAINMKAFELEFTDPDTQETKAIRVKTDIHGVNFGVHKASTAPLIGVDLIPGNIEQDVQGGWYHVKAKNSATMHWLFGEEYKDHLKAGTVGGVIGGRIGAIKSPHQKAFATQLAHQVMNIYKNRAFKDGSVEPYAITSRLSLLCYMTWIDVFWNCKSAKDRTGQNDAEIKFLAIRLYALWKAAQKIDFVVENGQTLEEVQNAWMIEQMPKPQVPLTPYEVALFHNLSWQTGNHKVQELNTGIPGYVPINDAMADRWGGKAAEEYMNGGSSQLFLL